MSTRIYLTITNTTSIPLTCASIVCEEIPGMSPAPEAGARGTMLEPGETKHFEIPTNNRVFCEFDSLDGKIAYRMAMTCPKSSHNSAAGYARSGLQTYSRTGTPVHFTFLLGEANRADWDHGDSNHEDCPEYGDCS